MSAAAAGGPLEASSAPNTILNNATSMQMAGNNNNSTMAAGGNNGNSEVRRIDVKETSVNIDGLKKDVLYELVVKAGNTYGKLREEKISKKNI